MHYGWRLSHTLYIYGFSPVWVLWCWIRAELWLKAFKHSSHWNNFLSSMVFLMFTKDDLWMKAFSHMLHLWRFFCCLYFRLVKYIWILPEAISLYFIFEGVFFSNPLLLNKHWFQAEILALSHYFYGFFSVRIFVWVTEIICKLSLLSFCFFILSSYMQGFSDMKFHGSSFLSVFLISPENDESWVWVVLVF